MQALEQARREDAVEMAGQAFERLRTFATETEWPDSGCKTVRQLLEFPDGTQLEVRLTAMQAD